MSDDDAAPSRAPKVSRPASAPPSQPRPASVVRGPDDPPFETADPTLRPRKLTLRGAPVCVVLIVVMSAIEAALALQSGLRSQVIDAYAFRPITLYGVYVGAFDASELVTLLTHQFLHGFPLHLAFNMLALAVLGPPLERAAGSAVFLLLFLICGVAGAVGQFAWEYVDIIYFDAPQHTLAIFLVGASGAIFGLLGADIAGRALGLSRIDPRFRRFSPVQFLLRSSIAVVVINVAIEFLGAFVAGAAHLGGFAAGLVLGPLLAGAAETEAPRSG